MASFFAPLLCPSPAKAAVPSTPVVTDDGAYTQYNDHLHASWSVQNPADVVEYQYAIGTFQYSTDVVNWKSAGTATSVTYSLPPLQTLTQGATYWFAVRARNADGWSSIGTSDGITVDATPPGQLYVFSVQVRNGAGLISDPGQSTGIRVDPDDQPPTPPVITAQLNGTTGIDATWTSQEDRSGIGQYEYAVSTSPATLTDLNGNPDVVTWTSPQPVPAQQPFPIHVTGLTLTSGKTYYLGVRVWNVQNPPPSTLFSTGTSNGVSVGSSGSPAAPVVTDDGVYTTNSTRLHASWSAHDSSGIADFRYAIGTSAGATDTADWTTLRGTATGITRNGLHLESNKTYYFAVTFRNRNGESSLVGSSDGIKVDTTPPTTPVVTDEGTYTPTTTQLPASWTSSDPESDIAEYQYAIGTSSSRTNVVNWRSAGTNTQVTITGLNLANGKTYYLAVRARNGTTASSSSPWSSAGVSAVGVSDGITVDTSLPTTPKVTDDGNSTASTTELHATWTASTHPLGIAEYQYAIGTSSGARDVVDWTSAGTNTEVTQKVLTLANGKTYYFAVRAKSNEGIWSEVGISDGITVDTGAGGASDNNDTGSLQANSKPKHSTPVWVWGSIPVAVIALVVVSFVIYRFGNKREEEE